MKIRVYQGESNRADECEMLGEFEFSGFRMGYRGEVKIEVTFEINTDGIVNVVGRRPRDRPEDLDHHLALLGPERVGHPAVHPAEPADTAGPGCHGSPGPARHLA